MTRFISIVLTALVAGVVALESCGTANYDPGQYTCFNNSLLCPIVNGVAYQACGEDCYSKADYTCFNGNFLCPFTSGGIATQACGDKCYSPFEYRIMPAIGQAKTDSSGPLKFNSPCAKQQPIFNTSQLSM
ncbi:carbohydrate binding-domain-containing protein [Mycena epipterygia]|nr:carbohydrate binding-domain-containing protein [Mycena epipterygia]